MAKLTPDQFVIKYRPFALACQKATGLHYRAILTQAALESGWSDGPTLFGVKDTDGVNGNEQLLTTTEVLDNPTYKFPVIISIVKYGTKWLYTVKDYFRKYPSPQQEFEDHTKFFLENSRYNQAWHSRGDAEEFLRQVARSGYATDPDYENKLISTLRWFEKHS